MIIHIKNSKTFIKTIVDPTGKPYTIETTRPMPDVNIDDIAENIETALKDENSFIAETHGNIISAHIKSDPTNLIAIEIVMPIIIESARFNIFVFKPLDFA